jgi:serine/threonine-protein kinase
MASLPTYAPGELVDDQYEVREFLGTGENGDVYRVFDLHLETEVALKLLKPNKGASLDWREAQILQRLRSDYILEVKNAAVIPGLDIRYITTAVAEGKDCETASGAYGVPVRTAMRWAQQASSGLARIHDERLLHRDVKPANVFLNADAGRALIADLGMAAAMDDDGETDRDGTPVTAAPELWTGGRCSVASDIYSMGITAFYFLTATWPRPNPSRKQLIANALAGTGPTLAEIAPHVPLQVARVVNRALSLEPTARQQSAAELAAEFGKCGEDRGRPWCRSDEHPGHHLCLRGDSYRGKAGVLLCIVPDGQRFAVRAVKDPSGNRIHSAERPAKPLAAALSAVRVLVRTL